jgi:hypothetical protein
MSKLNIDEVSYQASGEGVGLIRVLAIGSIIMFCEVLAILQFGCATSPTSEQIDQTISAITNSNVYAEIVEAIENKIDEPAGSDSPAKNGADDIDLSTVAWDGCDIRKWPVTTTVSASIGSKIVVSFDKANAWPPGRGELNGNLWVIANVGGKWRAATCEWLKHGQTVKERKCLASDHVQSSAWGGWKAQSGDTLYLAVSGLCRDPARNVSERSQFQKVKVP